jgi:hypothetical protein
MQGLVDFADGLQDSLRAFDASTQRPLTCLESRRKVGAPSGSGTDGR